MISVQNNDDGEEYAKKVDDVLRADTRERILQEFIIRPFIQGICTDKDVVPVDYKISGKCHNYELYCGKYEGKKGITIETPDLCVANDWIWKNDEKTEDDYIFTVEIKTVHSMKEFLVSPGYIGNKIVFENSVEGIKDIANAMLTKDSEGNYTYAQDKKPGKSIGKQIGIHLRGINKVIATDGVRWIFFYKYKDDCNNDVCDALPPIDLGKRLCKQQKKKYCYEKIDWAFNTMIIKGKIEYRELKNFEWLKYVIKEFCDKEVSAIHELNKELKSKL